MTMTTTATILSKTLILQTPNPHHHHRTTLNPTFLSLRRHKNLTFPLKFRPLALKPHLRITALSSSKFPHIKSTIPTLTNSTRTVSTFLAIAASASAAFLIKFRQFAVKIKSLALTPTPEEMANIQGLQEALTCTVGPMFFAAIRNRPSGALNTPLTVVAAGLAKWLDIYSGVLLVRVLLSWFPNIPWDRQPLSAIRDLCDPYLNLFRNIIPPIFDTLDVSPLLAFAVLGCLSKLLNSTRGL